MTKIDLHMHTTASDGEYSPSEVVRLAQDHNLEVIAITDHDTVAGIREARSAAYGTNLSVIAGIELGCENATRDVHLLGYAFDIDNEHLQQKLDELHEHRKYRAARIVENLNELGIPVQYELVQDIAGDGVIARPHIAQALVQLGMVASYQEAFDNYLGNHCPAYVPRLRLSPHEGIDLIHQAGGVAVVAHPCRYEDPLGVVREFAAQGVDGIEVYYPDNSPQLRQQLLQIAQELDLMVTGGCDFHRRAEDGQFGLGTEHIPHEVIAEILRRAKRYHG